MRGASASLSSSKDWTDRRGSTRRRIAGHDGAMRLPPAAAHVFVADISAPALTAADGAGAWRLCAFADAAHLEPIGDVQHVPAPRAVTVAFALTKGDKPELAVQKLTELGVDRIVPLVAAHSVVRWDDAKAARNV